MLREEFANHKIHDGLFTAEAFVVVLVLRGEKKDAVQDSGRGGAEPGEGVLKGEDLTAVLMEWEERFIALFVDSKTSVSKDDREHVTLIPRALRSIDDELARNVAGDVALFASAFALMVMLYAIPKPKL